MSKDKNKNLLNEGTVRRFMKLASLEPIANSFIKEAFAEEEPLEEEVEEIEEMAYAREDEEPEMEPEMEPEADDAG